MTRADAFLADIIEHPADDVPRLIFADWLSEHGDEERGEFIRLQIELASLPAERKGGLSVWGSDEAMADALKSDDPKIERRRRREGELLGENVSLVPNAVMPRWYKWCEDDGIDTKWVRVPGFGVGADCLSSNCFRRGFIAEVHLSCADWLQHGPAIVRRCPLQEVVFTTPIPDEVEQQAFLHSIVTKIPQPILALTQRSHKTPETALDLLSCACLAWAKAQPVAVV